MKISESITMEDSNYKNQSYLIRLETEWDNEPMLTIVHLESKTSYHVFVDDVEVYDNHYVNTDNLIDCLLTKLKDECFKHVVLNVVEKEESK
jgi:hypothetical protein